MRKIALFLCLLLPGLLISQTVFKEGFPKDLDQHKLIFLKHSPITVTADKKGNKAEKYLYLRQTNHNNVSEESNEKLVVAAMDYPFDYAFATYSSYKNLVPAGYKYVLISQVYSYDNLKKEPTEDVLLVFEYFLLDAQDNIAYKLFELDEMKVYDSKLIMKKFLKEVENNFPEAF